MGLSCSRIGPCQKAEVPSRRGVDSSPFRKTAIHRHGRGTRRLPGSARRIADCRHQSIGRHRSYQNTRRMYPSHSAPDSRYSEKTNSPTGGARTILLHVKYIPPRLAGFARSRASQGTGPQSGNIANCDQRTFQALPDAPDCGLPASVHRSAPLISKYASNVPITQRAGFALFRKNKFANQRSADRPSPRKVYPAASCGFCKKSRFAGHRAAVGKYRKLRSTHISGTTRCISGTTRCVDNMGMALEFTTSHLQDSLSLFRYYKKLAEDTMAQVTDAELSVTLDGEMNSIALIVKHMAGNMRSRWTDFLTTDGEKPNRQRDSEFLQPPATRAELMKLWEEG